MLALVAAVVVGVRDHTACDVGFTLGANVFCLLLAVLAFFYPRGGPVLRRVSVASAVLTTLAAIGSIAGDGIGHVHGLLGGIAIVVLLCQPSAKAWFAQPTTR
ncbi:MULTISPECIES: hypothetical protein [unclassified Streptomyces]|uniref:hypothetical protein n=1 Tax=unclassified Streptomyces TaxID=2593676 RepID=UPI0020304544|nr:MULTISPECIES: hypothetical protein [unclassified Streptomyces]MCM1976478.1 hypothetical protein [Streptomyces sp. G1]MCX5129933.1 hypothetical protein [Streptomyces sp. NBC_00347]MCX5300388.1 hypothetical protein [Streptomyces sp. NBC_00193]